MPVPRVDRPEIPPEYGVAKGHRARALEPRRGAPGRGPRLLDRDGERGGRPRVRPVDGLYVDGVLYVGGSPKTRWVREARPTRRSASISTRPDDVVIVDGDAVVLERNSDEFAERMAAASNEKYPEYGMTAAQYRAPGRSRSRRAR